MNESSFTVPFNVKIIPILETLKKEICDPKWPSGDGPTNSVDTIITSVENGIREIHDLKLKLLATERKLDLTFLENSRLIKNIDILRHDIYVQKKKEDIALFKKEKEDERNMKR